MSSSNLLSTQRPGSLRQGSSYKNQTQKVVNLTDLGLLPRKTADRPSIKRSKSPNQSSLLSIIIINAQMYPRQHHVPSNPEQRYCCIHRELAATKLNIAQPSRQLLPSSIPPCLYHHQINTISCETHIQPSDLQLLHPLAFRTRTPTRISRARRRIQTETEVGVESDCRSTERAHSEPDLQ